MILAVLAVTVGVLSGPAEGWAQSASGATQEGSTTSASTSMEGCIAKRASTQQALTFQDAASGFRYRVTGRNLARYSGQRVEIVGAVPRPRRLGVRGGLWPSPNVAGQAGAMDPAKAAIAAQPGGPESGTGAVELLPEFRVTRIRAVEGACE